MEDRPLFEKGNFVDRAAMSRRALLQRAGGALLGISALGTLAAACGGGSSSSETAATTAATAGATTAGGETTAESGGTLSGTINFFGWQGYDDANAAKPVTDQGVKLNAEYITTNDDIVTKLRGGGVGTIDVVTPFVGFIPALVANDLIIELDYAKLPSTDTFYPEFKDLATQFGDGKTYCAPLVWGDTPMIIRPDIFPNKPKSWLDLQDSSYKGTVITLDDTYGSIIIISRALFGAKDANLITPDQLSQVVDVWKKIKQNLVSIVPSFGDAIDVMARGDAGGLIQGWRFVEQQLNSKDVPAEAWMPEEGSFSWSDTYAIAKDAPNLDAAYALVDTMVSAKGDALVGAATGSGVTNEAARPNLPADQQDLYPYDDITNFLTTQTGFYALPLDPPSGITSYDDWIKAWEEIKSS